MARHRPISAHNWQLRAELHKTDIRRVQQFDCTVRPAADDDLDEGCDAGHEEHRAKYLADGHPVVSETELGRNDERDGNHATKHCQIVLHVTTPFSRD